MRQSCQASFSLMHLSTLSMGQSIRRARGEIRPWEHPRCYMVHGDRRDRFPTPRAKHIRIEAVGEGLFGQPSIPLDLEGAYPNFMMDDERRRLACPKASYGDNYASFERN